MNSGIYYKGDNNMNPIITFIVLGITMWMLNILFGFMQIKNFNKNYIEMRKIGRVAIGRKKGYFKAGTIVMIGIDDEGRILSSKKMQGTTVLARVGGFMGLEGKFITDLTENDLTKYNKLMRIAILDAVNNYKRFRKGIVEENSTNA
jgi:glucitol operon activator protein